MAFTVEISEQTADLLVVDILRNNLEYVRRDIARLESKAELMTFEQADLDNFRDLEVSFVKIVKYYLPPDKWDTI